MLRFGICLLSVLAFQLFELIPLYEMADTKVALRATDTISRFLATYQTHPKLILSILPTLLIYIASLLWFSLLLHSGSKLLIPPKKSKLVYITYNLGFIFFAIFGLHLFNTINFPNSLAIDISSLNYFQSLHQGYQEAITLGIIVFVVLLIIKILAKFSAAPKTTLTFLLCLLLPVGFSFNENYQGKQLAQLELGYKTHPTQPNIILIGLDAVRGDLLAQADFTQQYLPFFWQQSQAGAHFTDAWSLIGRTYPSWTSVLQGRYPLNTGTRYNLPQQEPECVMATWLNRQGYKSIYFSDEKRFSHIRQTCGFHHVWGAPIDALDFVVFTLADHALLNLLTLWPQTFHQFLPYTLANRGAAATYNPLDFNQLIKAKIAQEIMHTPKQPIFIGMHFTLPHWPWHWRTSPRGLSTTDLYLRSLQVLEHQVQDMLNHFKQLGLLENTIVVFLSDHGEAFSEPLYYPNQHSRLLSQYSDEFQGHGSDLGSINQLRILLNWRYFGDNAWIHNQIQQANTQTRATLIDIFPSLAYLIQQNPPHFLDGINLFAQEQTARDIFLETGFTPEAMRALHLDVAKVLQTSIDRFIIQADGTLAMDDAYKPLVIETKQRGILTGDWLLISHARRGWQLVNVTEETNLGWLDLHSLPENAPDLNFLSELRTRLCHFYGEECTYLAPFMHQAHQRAP
ncbi:Arylsulfatase A [Allopseudospirillum japonicum]|uniref:Arylsulfatase A n=1 Tax=Allopseudospirillum japonicum TaxID=64971 RepID=A0A1H6QBP3_9GAMM|nr:sulfatase-like hydrolase/transferase [Allopseudospirillum japonicum]SEI41173.1 Arylsulfatase A [Allopseudospirillum japonicum]